MKKLFFLALAAASLTLTGCGNSPKTTEEAATDTTATTDSTATAEAVAPADAVTGEAAEAIAQLTEQLDKKDAGKMQTTLKAIEAKIAELAKTDPAAAKTYVEQLQNWLKENAEQVKAATGGNATVSTAVETLTNTSTEKIVQGLASAQGALSTITDGAKTATETATKVTSAAKDAKEAVDKAKSVTSEQVQKKVDEKVNETKEAGKAKVREETGKAVEKGLKSLGL